MFFICLIFAIGGVFVAQIFVRLPDDLKASLQLEARRLGISLNAFVLQLFWHWFIDSHKS